MSIQVICLERIAHRNIGGRDVCFIDANAPSSRGNGYHVVVLVGGVVLTVESSMYDAV